jgi:hypothetical protein
MWFNLSASLRQIEMTFTHITAQHIVSSDGFEILPAGRHTKIYKEAGRQMEVALEFGRSESGRVCVELWPGAFARWEEGSPVLSIEEQQRIEQNFRAAMDFDELDVLVWDPRTEEYLETAAYHARLTAVWE